MTYDAEKAEARRTLKLGLLWHAPNSGNLGVGALTISNIALIRRVADELGIKVSFVIFGWVEPRPFYVEDADVEVFRINRNAVVPWFSRYWKAVRSCDAVFDIGGGDGFSDQYSLLRFIYQTMTKLQVILARRPLVLSPQTIGPFQTWFSRFISGLLLRASESVVCRDPDSRAYARQLSRSANLVESIDVAFSLPYQPAAKPAAPGEKVRVGVNVSGLLYQGGAEMGARFDLKFDYRAFVDGLIAYFLEQGASVELISHVNAEGDAVEDDYAVCQEIKKRFAEVMVVDRFAHPSEAKSYISQLDFFCGARMHACIAALSSGVPVVPIAYSRKFRPMFASLDYAYVADCTSMSMEDARDMVRDGFEHRDRLKEKVAHANIIATDKIKSYLSVVRTVLERAV